MSMFSTRLRELRNKANLSQMDLSKVMGISKSSINMYERGEREPGLDAIKTFAEYFDVQTDYLLGKHDDGRCVSECKKYNRLILEYIEGFRSVAGYDREQIEKLLDWKGMYHSLENDLYLADEGMYISIQNMLDVYGYHNGVMDPKQKKPDAISDELWNMIQNDPKAITLLEMILKMSKEQRDKFEKFLETL